MLIAAPASGQGKTTVTAALARRHRLAGRRVRVFKCGPDFLDPTILAAASGAPAYQLDLWMVGEAGCRDLLWRAAGEADVVIVEGVMGLFDGDPSAADLAARFGLPVVAVIDARAMAQSFGAVALGLATYRPDVRLAGVLANRVAGASHSELLKASLPPSIAWYGALRRGPDFELPGRHLGLVMASELADLDRRLDLAAAELARTAAGDLPPEAAFEPAGLPAPPAALKGQVVAVAMDEAFAFVYPANLDLLREMGAAVAPFSPLAGDRLPPCDSLYLPGGYPELHLGALSANLGLIADVRAHHGLGRPILAECGGLLYLLRTLAHGGPPVPMAGLLPGSAVLTGGLKGLGLMSVDFPEGTLRGHAFHHSELSMDLDPVLWGVRRDGRSERVEPLWRVGRLTASYIHFYLPSNPAAAAALLDRGRS
jgi:cobyrinic acid a,c-diamide synthase